MMLSIPPKAAFAFLTLSSLASATVLPSTGPITWKGKIFAERDEYTLRGDAKSIHAQIRSIRPDYDASAFANSSSINTRDLVRRNKNGGSCGNFDTGDFYSLFWDGGLYKHLTSLGGTSCNIDAGPGKCTRLACQDTTGIYLCNDNDYAIAPDCRYLASYADDIGKTCGQSSAISGQEFDSDGYNVVVAYANCNHSPDEAPSHPSDGWGPNGEASKICDDCMEVQWGGTLV